MTLVEFLTARLDEDQAEARAALNPEFLPDHPEYEPDDGAWSVACVVSDFPWHSPESHAAHLAGPSHGDECEVRGKGIRLYDEGGHTPGQAQHIARHDPARVLREVEAKQAILDYCEVADGGMHLTAVAEILATIWSDHPDYDPSWRP